jgi:hypothetical protein
MTNSVFPFPVPTLPLLLLLRRVYLGSRTEHEFAALVCGLQILKSQCFVSSWRKYNRALTFQNVWQGVVAVGHSLVALGGFNGERYSDTVEVWDTRMSSWVVSRPLPRPRAYMGAVAF